MSLQVVNCMALAPSSVAAAPVRSLPAPAARPSGAKATKAPASAVGLAVALALQLPHAAGISRRRSRLILNSIWSTGKPRRELLRPETRIAHAKAPARADGIRLCSGISELVESYDAFTLDQYGVLHDGRQAYPGASECLAKMKEAGKPCVILSNYAGRAERQKARLPDIGFNPDDLAGVVTSGEMAFRYLAKQGKFGKRVLWIAWKELEARGLGDFFEGLEGYTLAESVGEADFILVSGVQSRFAGTAVEDACDYEETGNHRLYRPIFRAAIQRQLPMICANPDLRVMRPGGWKAYLGGSLAAYYERLGGQVIYFGKPYTSAFEEARHQLCHVVAGGDADRALELELDEDFRICHIGDSLHHDVKGAISVGFDAAFVAKTGIHAEDMGGQDSELTQVGIRDLCEEEEVPLPQSAVPCFAW